MPRNPPNILFEFRKQYDEETREVIRMDILFAEKLVWSAKKIGAVYGVKKERGTGVKIMTVPPHYEDNGKRLRNMKVARRAATRYMKWASSQLYLLSQNVLLEEAD